MNDQLQQALAEIIGKASNEIDAGTQFLSAQIPDVIQQLLMWKMVSNLVGAGIVLLLFVALALMFRSMYKSTTVGLWRRGPEYSWESEPQLRESSYILIAVGGALAALSLVLFAAQSLSAIQIWIAPKVYLIEYAASLAK